jgi:hypothetical protein
LNTTPQLLGTSTPSNDLSEGQIALRLYTSK